MSSNASGRLVRDERGVTIVEVLIVIATLAILAGVVVVAVAAVDGRSQLQACRTERRIVLSALESSRAANLRSEYPGIGGEDGFDRVREAGFLGWDTRATYWRYVDPPLEGVLTSTHLQRTSIDVVPSSGCSY